MSICVIKPQIARESAHIKESARLLADKANEFQTEASEFHNQNISKTLLIAELRKRNKEWKKRSKVAEGELKLQEIFYKKKVASLEEEVAKLKEQLAKS